VVVESLLHLVASFVARYELSAEVMVFPELKTGTLGSNQDGQYILGHIQPRELDRTDVSLRTVDSLRDALMIESPSPDLRLSLKERFGFLHPD